MKKLVLLICLSLSAVVWAQKPNLMLPIGHSAAAPFIKFSSDGSYLLSCSDDLTAKLWDVKSGKLIYTLSGHLNAVSCGDINLKAQKIATVARKDQSAKIWSLKTGKLLFEIKNAAYTWNPVLQFSPDGKYLVLASVKNDILIWDVEKNVLFKKILTNGTKVERIKFSADGKLFAAGLYDGEILLCAISTGLVSKTFNQFNHAIESVDFSRDNKFITASSDDSIVYVWNLADGKVVKRFAHKVSRIFTVCFNHNGTELLTTAAPGIVSRWDLNSGKLIKKLLGHKSIVEFGTYSSDGKYILTASYGNGILRSTDSNKILHEYPEMMGWRHSAQFSEDGKLFASADRTNSILIYESSTGNILQNLGNKSLKVLSCDFSTDEKTVFVLTNDSAVCKINTPTGDVSQVYRDKNSPLWGIKTNPDGKHLLVGSHYFNKTINLETNSTVGTLYTNDYWINYGSFSNSGNITVNFNHSRLVTLVETETGIVQDTFTINDHIADAKLSPDGNYLALALWDRTAKIWDIPNHRLLKTFQGHTFWLRSVNFNYDATRLVTAAEDSKAIIWNVESEKAEFILSKHAQKLNYAEFNKQGNKVVTCSEDKSILIWNASNGLVEKTLTGHLGGVYRALFALNDSLIVSASSDKVINIWSVIDGKRLLTFEGETFKISPSGNLLAINNQSMLSLIDLRTMTLLYSKVFLNNLAHVSIDANGHYDGSELARKQLYFICGNEIIELDQVKDQLWVPNLAERIMNGDSIRSKTLNQLNICGLTPEIIEVKEGEDIYFFKVKPRRGGLGETVLMINGIEARRYKPDELVKNGEWFDLKIKKSELEFFFLAGKQNPVHVKAFTADNSISSRGAVILESQTKKPVSLPNLYAVMVGVSDYKGDELDLRYAAKDAGDIANALSVSAKKLLNTDGKEHVFIYNLNTSPNRYLLPEKQSIQKTLSDIGKVAKANDILIIFFAGHGVMEGEKKQFYFLTSEASKFSDSMVLAEVGISTNELTEWMKPQNIAAQKRILIFDACNSGQAIKDFVKMGNSDQNYLAARNDDNAQQIKAIDKLNEKSGLFILSASASNQSAYELGRYSQGLLTYALLKAIKQDPAILEDGKYLNVSKWFNAAEKTVSELSKENGARQEPQIVTNTNFNIGLVDEEVISKIVLPNEKPLFASSNFQNADENIADDDLEMSKLINAQLNNISTRGIESSLVFMQTTNSPDAYVLSGRYTLTGNTIKIIVNIKQNKVVKHKFELIGNTEQLSEFSKLVTEKAVELVK
jgi:WD40 repeat protein